MKQDITKHYAGGAATMRQRMRTMQAHFAANATAFQAFNPAFDATYATRWLAALDAADAATTHEVRVGELKEDTATVATVMEHGRRSAGRGEPGPVRNPPRQAVVA